MAKEKRKSGRAKGSRYVKKDVIAPGLQGRLQGAMDHRGITNRAALGRLIGHTRAVIGQYLDLEGKKSSPSAVILLKLSKALRVSPYWLVFDEGEMLDGIQEITSPQVVKLSGRVKSKINQPKEFA